MVIGNKLRGRKGFKALPPLSCSDLEILAELFSDRGHFTDDVIDVKNHFHHGYCFVIDGRIKFFLYLRFYNMVDCESQRDSCQRTCISGVTSGDCFSSESGSFAFSSAKENDNVLRTILLSKFLNSLLVFQIHCTSGRSDEAFR